MAGVTEIITTLVTDAVTGNNTNETTTTTTSTTSTTTLPVTTAALTDVPTDDPESVEVRAGIAFVLATLCIVSIILNVITLVVLLKSPAWKKSANYLLVNITISDLLMTLLWAVPAVVIAVVWKWNLGEAFCTFHEFIGTWCHVVVMHTLVTVGVEKVALFWRPSKHREVFYRTVVLVLIGGIWLFDLVIALFPIMGWGNVMYSPYQFQCAEEYKNSHSLLNFNFVVIYLIPVISIVVLYGLVIHKVRRVRTRVSPGKDGKIVLEEDKNVPHETYGRRYAKQQKKYKTLGRPANPPEKESEAKRKKTASSNDAEDLDDGYESNSKVEGESSDEGPLDYETLYEKKQTSLKKRIYLFKEKEFKFAVTLLLATLAYFLCWFPLLVVSYYWAYNFENPLSNAVLAIFTCVTLVGLFIKPIVYITNRQVRKSITEVFKRHSKSKKEINSVNE